MTVSKHRWTSDQLKHCPFTLANEEGDAAEARYMEAMEGKELK